MMQRLLTGYAVVFNLRHHRSGHLFQNRFKSIVCEEDSYLLELVRYIHLNPIRASLVTSMDKLDTFKWSGHAGLMGQPPLPGQNLDEVLLLFDENPKKAREKYRAFVAVGYRGIDLSKRLGLSEAGVVFAARRGEKLNVISKLMEIWSNTPADAVRYNSDDTIHEILE